MLYSHVFLINNSQAFTCDLKVGLLNLCTALIIPYSREVSVGGDFEARIEDGLAGVDCRAAGQLRVSRGPECAPGMNHSQVSAGSLVEKPNYCRSIPKGGHISPLGHWRTPGGDHMIIPWSLEGTIGAEKRAFHSGHEVAY